MDRKEIIKEIEPISPALAKIKHQLNYDVPSDYFTNLSEEVLEKTTSSGQNKYPKLRILLPYVAVAASIAIIISTYSLMKSPAQIDQSSIYYEYVMNNIDEYDEQNLIEIGLSDIDLNSPMLRISEDVIDAYLIDEDYLLDLEIPE